MSEFLELTLRQARLHPGNLAFSNSLGEHLSYGELDRQSAALACRIKSLEPGKAPVVVYGHKQAAMLICMFACMRSGHAYVPVDTSFPDSRLGTILGQLDDPLVLCAADAPQDGLLMQLKKVIEREQLASICAERADEAAVSALQPIAGDDASYILFTSGSTGTPKGVVQRAESIDLTSRYFKSLLPQGEQLVCFNRAPFSFDLSIFDLLMALPCGHSMFSLEKNVEESLAATFEALHDARVNVWVSTPSFLSMCLTDPSFNTELLPDVRVFIMCGETLHNATARACLERFGDAKLVNMYGPTETCGAVTDVSITKQMAQGSEPLPVGAASPYSELQIVDPEQLTPLPQGERGEILILGDTAASGYYKLPEKSAEAFFARTDGAGRDARCYRTGDEGWLDAQGLLHYCGRYDFQLKLNGYRIELGDIEENLNSLDAVAACCVLPTVRNGLVSALCAHVAPAPGTTADRHLTKQLKEQLKKLLPAYMIPRTFKYHDALPVTANGKIDRKALQAGAAEGR